MSERKSFRGSTVQVSVYLPKRIHSFYTKRYSPNGYTSVADYMRDVLRQHYLKRRDLEE